MSKVEKIVRKSENANEVFVAGRVFCKLAVIFFLISLGIMIATLIELRNIELTSTKGIIFVTLCAISILEFLIFLGISTLCSLFLIGFISFSSFISRRKEVAILRSLGASETSVEEVFIYEKLLSTIEKTLTMYIGRWRRLLHDFVI